MANWLVYDARGQPTWYSLQPGSWLDPTTFVAIVFAPSSKESGNLVGCTTARLCIAGEASIKFHGADRATLAHRVDREVGEVDIVRMR